MAELKIKITADAKPASEALSNLSGNVKKFRNELLKSNSIEEAEQGTLDRYVEAVRLRNEYDRATKSQMQALRSESKHLSEEIFILSKRFGEDNDTVRTFREQLAGTKQEMENFTANMDDAGNASGKTGLKLLSVAKNILKFQLLMGPITSVVRGFRTTLSDSVKLAGEAEQRFSKLATVFDGFGDSAKRMAQSLASSIGVANSTAASALSTVGDLLQAQGMGTGESLSTAASWVSAFQDIIAFKDINMSLEEFAQNFMSGAAGNLRNFRTFGSIVKESAVQAELAKKGLDKLTGSELELAKMTTRANMALEQQKNAMGATEREWNTMLSVNRRLNEAQKQFKENLGDELNQTLKPMRTVLTDILDAWNNIVKAKERYANVKAGTLEATPQYDENSSSQRMALQQMIIENRAGIRQGNSMVYNMTGDIASRIAAATGASLVQVLDMFEKMGGVDSRNYDRDQILKQAAESLAAIVQQQKDQSQIESNLGTIRSMVQGADNFIELLASITGAGGGINAQNLSWMETLKYNINGKEIVQKKIAEYINENITGAMESISSADLASWSDAISEALGESDMDAMLKGRAESFRQFYEALHNYFSKDGVLSEDEISRLGDIRIAYQEAKKAAEDYMASLQAQTSLQAYGDRLRTSALVATGMDASEAGVRVSWANELAEIGKLFKELGTNTIEINGQMYKQKDLIALVNEQYGEQIDKIKEANKAMTSWENALAQVKDSPLFKSIDQFKTDFAAGKEWAAGKGATEGAANAAGVGAGIAGFLATLATQTETFQKFMDILQPAIETMNNFLKPLQPAIEAIGEAISYMVYAILKPLWDSKVIQIIATALLTIGKVVETIAAAVTNVGRGIGNFFRGLFGMEKKAYEDIGAIWDDYYTTLDQIWGATFQIAKNTDPSNDERLKAYREMYEKGMITESEFSALLRGIQGARYDSVRTSGSYAWNNGRAGTTNVYYGDLKFTINGTNLSADQIADAVARKIEFNNRTGHYSYA